MCAGSSKPKSDYQVRSMNPLLDLCREWEEVLTLRREELKEWESAISVQGGHATSAVEVKV